MGYRKEQVASTLHRAISQVLTVQMSDPRIRGMVSVTNVDLSPDFHVAHIGVSVHPSNYESTTIHGLQHASKHIHAKVCKQVRMRTVPKLVFQLDESLKKQAQVLSAINDSIAQDNQQDTDNLPASGTDQLNNSE